MWIESYILKFYDKFIAKWITVDDINKVAKLLNENTIKIPYGTILH